MGTCTTLRTPGTAFASVASNDFTLPPKTGGRATTAVSRPGNCTSMPNCARPVIFSGVSRRLVGFPMIFQSFGSLSGTVFGAGSFAGGLGQLAVARPLAAGDDQAVLGPAGRRRDAEALRRRRHQHRARRRAGLAVAVELRPGAASSRRSSACRRAVWA